MLVQCFHIRGVIQTLPDWWYCQLGWGTLWNMHMLFSWTFLCITVSGSLQMFQEQKWQRNGRLAGAVCVHQVFIQPLQNRIGNSPNV